MTVLRHAFLALHFIGLAAILAGWLVYRRSAIVDALSVWGARIQVLTGLVLVGIAEALATEARPVNHAKIGVKLVLALAVVVCYEMANAKQRKDPKADVRMLVTAGAGLAVLNILVATLW